MNKGKQFWLEIWEQNEIPFHRDVVDSDLIEYVKTRPPGRVLLPLCGKSLDIIWLWQQGFDVVGIELAPKAIYDLIAEHQLDLRVGSFAWGKVYTAERLTLYVADVFEIPAALIAPVDFIFDRAALVALSPKLRAPYVSIGLSWLKPQGTWLLKTLQYPEGLMQGPPYSIDGDALDTLFANRLSCQRLASRSREMSRPFSDEIVRFEVTEELWLLSGDADPAL